MCSVGTFLPQLSTWSSLPIIRLGHCRMSHTVSVCLFKLYAMHCTTSGRTHIAFRARLRCRSPLFARGVEFFLGWRRVRSVCVVRCSWAWCADCGGNVTRSDGLRALFALLMLSVVPCLMSAFCIMAYYIHMWCICVHFRMVTSDVQALF